MTGGLRALVAASRPATPRLEPRPVSRFEVERKPMEARGSEELDAVEQPAEITVTPTRSRVDQVTHDAPSVQASDAPKRVAVAPVRIRIEPADRYDAVCDGPPVALAASPHQRAPLTQEPTFFTPLVINQISRSTPGPSPQLANGTASQRRSMAASDQAAPERPHRAPRRDAEYSGALVAPPLPVMLTTPAAPQVSPPRRRPGPSPTAQAQPAKPDVHISIGRIEVLATPAAAPTSREPRTATSPVIGLDDYLAERNAR